MTELEKIKRCVSLVWYSQDKYIKERIKEYIEDFCHNELNTYLQLDEIMKYFKRIESRERIECKYKEEICYV